MKTSPISNPLTIIGLFASLSEVTATVTLIKLEGSIQEIFLWFVMGFPTMLVLLFFWTLHKDYRVLYAPRDYQRDESFIAMSDRQRIDQKVRELVTEEHDIETVATREGGRP